MVSSLHFFSKEPKHNYFNVIIDIIFDREFVWHFFPGPCCTEECRYASPAKMCSKSTGCTKNQTCSGLSFSCDTPEPVKNGTLCDQGRRVCYAGQCSVSVCEKYDMESCSCTAEAELCDLCCKQDGVCTPASRLTRVWFNHGFIIL